MGANNRSGADAPGETTPEITPEITAPEETTPEGTAPEENRTRARAAFDRYRAARGMPSGPHFARAGGGHPSVSPYPHGMPGWTFPSASGMMPQPPIMPGQTHIPAGTGSSLFASIGNLISLSVNALNTGLAGGLQIVEGFSGHGGHGASCCDSHHQSCGCSCGYHGSGCGGGHHGGYTDCCGSCCDCCCNPSVNNCCG